MSTAITTLFGQAVPPAPPHAITVHVPLWENVEKFGADPRAMIMRLRNVYPRMKPSRHIDALAAAVLGHIGASAKGQTCYIFSSLQSARECVAYATSPRRDDGANKKPLKPDQITIRAFHANDDFYCVLFTPDNMSVLAAFWTLPGCGVSSRFAECNVEAIDQLVEIAFGETHAEDEKTAGSRPAFAGPVHDAVRERILTLLRRAAINPDQRWPTAQDVYFFPTGMAAIYKPHTYLSSSPDDQGTTILFGMAFTNTITAFAEFGPESASSDAPMYKFYGTSSAADADDLEEFMRDERTAGRQIQAIWVEFPANPLLAVPDLLRLRQLADMHDTLLIVDDTLGSFANVDVLSVADLLVTSLTKTFNGYADAMGGSVVLNPKRKHHARLQKLFTTHHVPELYAADAQTIELNSRDYLERSARHNHNAATLVESLKSYIHTNTNTNADPDIDTAIAATSTSTTNNSHDSSSETKILTKIYYPTTDPVSLKNYTPFLRRSTPDFAPGHGCLFTLEFTDPLATEIFYDTLNVHCGPHLGAPRTLMFAYTVVLYGTRLDWAAEQGLKPTQLRIAVGLEDASSLVEDFKRAMERTLFVLRERRKIGE